MTDKYDMSSEKIMNADEIIERAKVALGVKTDTQLAKSLKIKQPTISVWRKRNSVDLKKIIIFCNHVSLEWLLFGEGEMKETPDIDDTTKKLLLILESLNDEQKRDVLRYAQKEELLSELLRERKAG